MTAASRRVLVAGVRRSDLGQCYLCRYLKAPIRHKYLLLITSPTAAAAPQANKSPFCQESIACSQNCKWQCVPSCCCVCRAGGEKWPCQMPLLTPACNDLVTLREASKVSSLTKWACNTVISQGVVSEDWDYGRSGNEREWASVPQLHGALRHCESMWQCACYLWTHSDLNISSLVCNIII